MKTKKMYFAVLVMMAAVVAMFTTSMPVYASKTDDRIESSARKSYVFQTYLSDDDIKIQSKDGAVTLTGTVLNEFHKSLAYETLVDLPGVKSVDNRLELKSASPTPYSDAWLNAKVTTALLFHRSVSAAKTEVKVQDGIVTLQGVAESQEQKELAAEYARDVEGVKDVKNEMTVSMPAKTTKTSVGRDVDDASITAQVKMTLLLHRSTSTINTKVKTEKGVVTLSGKAGNAAEKDLTTKLANDINGVKRVNNQMTVE